MGLIIQPKGLMISFCFCMNYDLGTQQVSFFKRKQNNNVMCCCFESFLKVVTNFALQVS